MANRITLGNVVIDRERFEVLVDGRRVDLTYVEFELLYQLARNAGKVIGRQKLMSSVWGEPPGTQDRKLTVHLSRLRKKMRGSKPWHIETVTRRGYALVDGQVGDSAYPGGGAAPYPKAPRGATSPL
jgi:DNA-binding response OmpR family regulator